MRKYIEHQRYRKYRFPEHRVAGNRRYRWPIIAHAHTQTHIHTQRYVRGCNLTLHRVYVNNEWEPVSVISGAQHRVLDVGGVVVFIAARRRVLLSARSLKYLNTTPASEFQPSPCTAILDEANRRSMIFHLMKRRNFSKFKRKQRYYS